MADVIKVRNDTVTANAVLLLGYLGGRLVGDLYKLAEVDPDKGECLIENKQTGNRYKVRVVQVSGQE